MASEAVSRRLWGQRSKIEVMRTLCTFPCKIAQRNRSLGVGRRYRQTDSPTGRRASKVSGCVREAYMTMLTAQPHSLLHCCPSTLSTPTANRRRATRSREVIHIKSIRSSTNGGAYVEKKRDNMNKTPQTQAPTHSSKSLSRRSFSSRSSTGAQSIVAWDGNITPVSLSHLSLM